MNHSEKLFVVKRLDPRMRLDAHGRLYETAGATRVATVENMRRFDPGILLSSCSRENFALRSINPAMARNSAATVMLCSAAATHVADADRAAPPMR